MVNRVDYQTVNNVHVVICDRLKLFLGKNKKYTRLRENNLILDDMNK